MRRGQPVRDRRRLAAVTVAVLLLAVPGAGGAPPLPLREVVAGLRGEVRTVYAGREVESVPLEILGVAPGFAGPGRDVILARLAGERASVSGVVAGMSGSPVLVDGRLVGALAYRIGSFTQEAIAGITPIEQMLAIPEQGGPPEAGAGEPRRYPAAALVGLAEWPETPPADAPLPPFRTPLAASGLDPGVAAHFAPLLRGWGLGPVVQAVAAGSPVAEAPRRLAAGEPVAAVLVAGDMILAGTGTVTLVDGDRVLALGHPLARGGNVDFPMARAEILVTVPSLAGSFKLARVGEVVGAFHQDRPQGLAGRLGAQARTVPVRVGITSSQAGAGVTAHHFELVRATELTAGLLELVVSTALLADDGGARSGNIILEGTLTAGGHPPLSVRNVFAGGETGPPLAFHAARYVAALLATVAGSPGGAALDLAVDLEFQLGSDARQLRVEEVRSHPPRVRPGQPLEIEVRLRQLPGGGERLERFTIPIPDLPPGTQISILAGDAAAVVASDGAAALAGILQAPDTSALLRALGRLRPADGLYLRVARPAPGWLLGGELLHDLPPSVAAVIRAGTTSPAQRPLAEAVIYEEGRNQGALVVGAGHLRLTVDGGSP